MNNVASRARALAAGAVVCLVLIAVASVPVAEAVPQQQSETEAEIAARVRAELEQRLAQLTAQLRELEVARELELSRMHEQLERALVGQEQVRELTERRLEEALMRSNRQVDAARLRAEEVARQAMVAAEEATQRASRVGTLNLRGNCELFGERILDRAEELALSDPQQADIRAAQRATRREGIERRAATEVAEMDLEALYEAGEPDLDAIRAKLEELAMLQVDGQIAGLELRRQVRAIMTAEQAAALDEMRDDADVRVVVSGRSTVWNTSAWRNFGRFGC